MGNRPRNARDAGFTLIEVMVALAILGSAMFVLLETHYSALNAQSKLRDEVLVRNLMAQALGIAQTNVIAGTFKDSDDFGKRYPDFKYSFDAQPVGAEYPALYDVLVTVEGPNIKKEEHSFMLTRDPTALMAAGLNPNVLQQGLNPNALQQQLGGAGSPLQGGVGQFDLNSLTPAQRAQAAAAARAAGIDLSNPASAAAAAGRLQRNLPRGTP